MKRLLSILCAAVLLSLVAVPASASNFYLIPDSNTRLLTREELWTWQYEALQYIINEIFARHGFHFKPGEKFDNYFSAQLWYKENEQYADNQDIYDHLVTSIEWQNESLAKKVREEMRNAGTINPTGKPVPQVSYEPPIYGAFSSFSRQHFTPGQQLKVYTGPGAHYFRAANGKAMASTNGEIYVGGWENGWLMVMYWTNNGNIRVGYVNDSDFVDHISAPQLSYSYIPAIITSPCALTDDPVATFQTLINLSPGANVTYLSEYVNEYEWAYIEVQANRTLMRGFVEANAITIADSTLSDPPIGPIEVGF